MSDAAGTLRRAGLRRHFKSENWVTMSIWEKGQMETALVMQDKGQSRQQQFLSNDLGCLRVKESQCTEMREVLQERDQPETWRQARVGQKCGLR